MRDEWHESLNLGHNAEKDEMEKQIEALKEKIECEMQQNIAFENESRELKEKV